MTKEEIIKALRDMARYPTVTLPRDSEALKMAADLLAQPEQDYPENFIHALAFHTAISDLEPEQEPVAAVPIHPKTGPDVIGCKCGECGAWQRWTRSGMTCKNGHGGAQGVNHRLYTSPPPQRTWVGLTWEEIYECFKITPDQYLPAQIYKRIEAKLKEKNFD